MRARLVATFRTSLVLAAFFSAAGGLALAALSGVAALVAVTPRALVRALARPPLALILAALAIAWTCLSFAWSPYDRPDQAIKLALLTPLFLALPFFAGQLGEADRARVRPFVIFAAASSLLFLTIEALLQAPVTLSYKLDVEGYAPDHGAILDLSHRMLSRGAVPALMLAGPAALLLWRSGHRAARTGALVLLLLSVFVAAGFSVEANIVALAGGLALAALAWRFPQRTLPGLLVATSLVLVLAPFLFRIALSVLPESLIASLPISWAWRIEIWDHALTRIAERPLTGHGLDAARAIEETVMLRGMEIDLLPLHAHNAGLTIWLQTGFVGALLWAFTLWSAAVWIARRTVERDLAMMVVYVAGVWLISVMLGIGVWQEWHHGALSLAIAGALIGSRAKLAGDLRRSR